MPEKQNKKELVVYADFEYFGKAWKAGDAFAVPAGYTRDYSYDEFSTNSKKNAPKDMAFIETKTGRRVTVPVMEA